MILSVGEGLNSSCRSFAGALLRRDADAVRRMIEKQVSSGAEYLDLNTAAVCGGDSGLEAELAGWVSGMIPEETGIMLDSADTGVLSSAHTICAGHDVILNSVTLTRGIDEISHYAAGHGFGVVLLPMKGGTVPESAEERAENVRAGASKLIGAGVPAGSLYADMLVTPAVGGRGAEAVLSALRMVKSSMPEIRTIIGLSNVSFGLPRRSALNTAMMAAAVCVGLDAAIWDVTDQDVRSAAYAACVLSGKDDMCLEYTRYMRHSS